MNKAILCVLTCCLLCVTGVGQTPKRELSVDEVKAFVEDAFNNNQRVIVTLKNLNVRRSKGFGSNFPRKFSVKVTGIADDSFHVEDTRPGLNEILFGEISGNVEYSNVAAIQKQNRFTFGLRKTGEAAATTGYVTAVIAISPVVFGGMAVCFASGGKYGRWACPR
jgi:hypothetical protein